MGACTLDYNLNLEGFRSEDPLRKSMGVIEIRMRQRYQLRLKTSSANVNDPAATLALVEDIVSPDFVEDFDFPPHVLASSEFRKLSILDMLKSFCFDPHLCECLRPCIESFAIDASQAFGVNKFVVVADVEVTKIQVVDQDEAVRMVWDIRLEKKKGSAPTEVDAHQRDYSTRKPSFMIFIFLVSYCSLFRWMG